MSTEVFLNNPSKVCAYSVDKSGSESLRDESIRRALELIVQDWRGDGEEAEVRPLTGGITNLLYLVSNASGRRVIVRLFGQGTELFVDRQRENVVFSELSRLGVGPTFYGLFENGRVEGYLPARALLPEEMHEAHIYPKVAAAVAKLHSMGSLIQGLEGKGGYCLWSKLLGFFDLARGISFADDGEKEEAKRLLLEQLDLPEMARQLDWLKQTVEEEASAAVMGTPASIAFESVLCHNDLLSGNILLDLAVDALIKSDGGDAAKAQIEGIVLIDFEYAAYNYRGFDLANHFCEFAGFDFNIREGFPTTEVRHVFIRHYLNAACVATSEADRCEWQQTWLRVAKAPSSSSLGSGDEANREQRGGEDDEEEERDRCLEKEMVESFDRIVLRRFTLASHLFWGSWAVVQSSMSSIDFDFIGYAKLRFDGYFYHKAMWCAEEALA